MAWADAILGWPKIEAKELADPLDWVVVCDVEGAEDLMRAGLELLGALFFKREAPGDG